ncbi:MAG TPA: FkbM family methyltransferase [Candidatus Omnitrophota bacterium]|nr:FkbM family methyltransferase [Candidatus Omnitrophota bacterium]
MNFFELLLMEILNSQYNYFTDNYDQNRFGRKSYRRMVYEQVLSVVNSVMRYLGVYYYRTGYKKNIGAIRNIGGYFDAFNSVYDLLEDDYSKKLLVKIIAYRIMGEKKVKLPLNNPTYWDHIKKIKSIVSKTDKLCIDFLGWELNRIDLNLLNIPVVYFSRPTGAALLWFLRLYQGGPGKTIRVRPGDVVIDCGCCWGDTALKFAFDAGRKGHIYSFEINQKNIEVATRNFELNPVLKANIQLINAALWHESDKEILVDDNGPGSAFTIKNTKNNIVAKTLTIDDFVERWNIRQVNFIKMDIEGAELKALEGAKKTIQKFKPKLAISLYHTLDDFVNIPKFVKEVNKDYKLYVEHFSIHREETVLFAG